MFIRPESQSRSPREIENRRPMSMCRTRSLGEDCGKSLLIWFQGTLLDSASLLSSAESITVTLFNRLRLAGSWCAVNNHPLTEALLAFGNPSPVIRPAQFLSTSRIFDLNPLTSSLLSYAAEHSTRRISAWSFDSFVPTMSSSQFPSAGSVDFLTRWAQAYPC